MSYTQYQQYGGNPYNNGPDAEAGIGGPVSFPAYQEIDEQCARDVQTAIDTDFVFSQYVGLWKSTCSWA
jgi:hypothetical protein